MAINKVIYGDETLIDITDSTVTADNLAEGAIAYGANGEQVVGRATFGSGETEDLNQVLTEQETIIEELKTILQGKATGGNTGTTDTRFKDLAEGALTEINDNSITTVRAYAFYGMNTLTNVKLPLATYINENAFYNCKNLVSVNMPLVETLGANVFYGCSNLPNLDLQSVGIISTNCFYNCTSLASIYTPMLTALRNNVFYGCQNLTILDLHFVSSIGAGSFFNCQNLKTIILRSTTICTLGNSNALNNTPIAKGTGYIYVPDDLVASYKEATNWSIHANQFRAISELGG